MKAIKISLPLFLVLILVPVLLFAQTSNETYHITPKPNVFKNDDGATLEYLGLKNWTAHQVQDSLKSLAPNHPVHACVAILKNEFGFEDADVNTHIRYTEDGNRLPPYTVVTLIEPDSKKGSDTWSLPKNKRSIIKEWTAGYDFSNLDVRRQVTSSAQFLRKESGKVVIWSRAMKSSMFSEEEKKFLKKFYDNLNKQNSKSDREMAYDILNNDGNIHNRILASLILLNFKTQKEDAYEMLKQIRSNSDELNSFSGNVLKAMARYNDNIDWSGATKSIKTILSGTSIKEFSTVLSVLTDTQISPKLADSVLNSNTFLLQEYLRSSFDGFKSTGMAFANQISGKNFKNADEAIIWISMYE